MRLQTLSLVLALIAVTVAALDDWGHSHDSSGDHYAGSRPHRSGDSRAVLLKDVSALTLRRGLKTNGRRVSPVKQLQCLSGCEFEPGIKCAGLPATLLLEHVPTLCIRGFPSVITPYLVLTSKSFHNIFSPSLFSEVVQCTAVGFDGASVQWRCEADLPSHLRFGRTEVSCEVRSCF